MVAYKLCALKLGEFGFSEVRPVGLSLSVDAGWSLPYAAAQIHTYIEMGRVMRQTILPSHDVVRNLMSEGKILAGGYVVGERAAAFIFDAESNAELDALLQSLPYWGLVKMKVTALEDVEGRSERDRQFAEQIEQSLQR